MKTIILTLLVCSAWALPAQQRSLTGPVIPDNFPDPSSLKTGDIWVAYAGPNGNPNYNVITAVSSDFRSWTVNHIEALPDPGSWVSETARVWAPDVVQLPNGEFLMYYTAATAADPRIHCIGYARSKISTGPFIASEKPLFCDPAHGGSIDPDGFLDPVTKKRYIIYKVDANAIGNGGSCGNDVPPVLDTPLILQEVNKHDGITLIGNGVVVINKHPDDGPTIEAPTLHYDEASQTYVLLFTSGCYTSTGYSIQLATSRQVTGPYTRRGTWLATGGTSAKIKIPGSPDFEPSSGNLIFHGDIGSDSYDDSRRIRAMYAANVEYSVNGLSIKDLL